MAAQAAFLNSLLNAAFKGGTHTGGVIKMGLFKTGLPTSTGVELSGGSYARQTITFATPTVKKAESSVDLSFTGLPTGPSNTVVAYGIYDGTTLIDEGSLSSPFTPDVTNNEFKTSYKFDLSGA